jgi:hypothetical protein
MARPNANDDDDATDRTKRVHDVEGSTQGSKEGPVRRVMIQGRWLARSSAFRLTLHLPLLYYLANTR